MTFDQPAKDDEKLTSRVTFAAGGIVWRQMPHGREVAVIHRPTKGDCCLPKGKLEEKESWEEAALREIKEEIGWEAKITSFAGVINYMVEGIPKVVLFWNMVLDEEFTFRPTKEVCEVEWLTPREAIRKIDYAEQKSLLKEVSFGQKQLIFSRVFGWLQSILILPKSRRHRRLASSLACYRVELERRIEQIRKQEQSTLPSWAVTSHKLLRRVETALKENRIDEGWRCFHAAHRMEIYGLQQNELEARTEALQHECAKKLSSWRKEAVDTLLRKEEGAQKSNITKDQVYQATLIRDEGFNNQYHKIGLLQDQMKVLFFLLFIVLGLLLLLSWYHVLPLDRGPVTSDWKMLVAVMLFGLLGGAVSAVLSLARTSTQSRIPEQIAHNLITLMRTFVGAASAVAVYFLLLTGIIRIAGELNTAQIFAFSFIAGFTERLVTKAVESLAGKER